MAIVKTKDRNNKRVGIDTRPPRRKHPSVDTLVKVQPPIEIPIEKPGHSLPLTWTAVPGCTTAELTVARIELAASGVERPIATNITLNNLGRIIDLDGMAHVVKIVLKKPTTVTGTDTVTALTTSADLQNNSLRFVVAADLGDGQMTPCLCSPGLGTRGSLPPALRTMSFDAGVLSFDALTTRTIRFSLVRGNAPEEFEEIQIDLGSISVIGLSGPVDCTVKSVSGTTIWSYPDELPLNNAKYTIDLRQAFEADLAAALKAGAPLVSGVTISGESGLIKLWQPAFTGALKRSVPGITRVELCGEAVGLPSFDQLPAEQPTHVTGDLAVSYNGIRLCSDLCDHIPPGPTINGSVVGNQPVICPLPANALQGLPLARIGLIGRAPVTCELALSIVELVNGTPVRTLAIETTQTIQAADRCGLYWIDLDRIQYNVPQIGIAVRAVRGRFLWAQTGQRYALRLAVWDPSPPTTALTLAGLTVTRCDATAVNKRNFAFPAAAFVNLAPRLMSLLFLTVDISDLELRYAR
jgi:hypothetical protein